MSRAVETTCLILTLFLFLQNVHLINKLSTDVHVPEDCPELGDILISEVLA